MKQLARVEHRQAIDNVQRKTSTLGRWEQWLVGIRSTSQLMGEVRVVSFDEDLHRVRSNAVEEVATQVLVVWQLLEHCHLVEDRLE